MESQSGNTKAATAEVWHDWVAEMFEPAFGSTIDELVAGDDPEKRPKVRHISVYDPDAVKRVYEKVHMMTQLDEEMKRQKAENKKSQSLKSELRKDHPEESHLLAQEKKHECLEMQGKTIVDLNDSCIWDSNEIAILRHAYKTIKQENIDAVVHVRQLEKRNHELEAKTMKQEKIIQAQKEKLTHIKKANMRLKIHCDKLQSELDYCLAKTSAMEEIMTEIKQEKSDMMKELHDNRVETDRARMDRDRIQLRLDTLKQEALAEKLTAEENIKTMCKQVILDLQKKVLNLTEELNKERNVHKNTARGLDHLRSHFASLAVHEILPSKAVKNDQVDRIDY